MRGLDDKSDISGGAKTTPRQHFHSNGDGGGCGAVADDDYSGFQQSNGGTEYDFEEECVSSDVVDGDDVLNDGEMTIMNDDDDPLDDDEEEVMEHSISFQVSRATVTRTGLLPCCVFVGRVTWGTTDWEIYFGQKQLMRLHVNLYIHQMRYRRILMRGVHLPWTIWREKRAEKRVMDVHVVQQYIRMLLKDRDLRNSEPLLAFLEVSPSRAMSRYGPSLKEGYVHMRMNGPFQLPLYTCFNRTIETLYRHLYRTWMRISYVSSVVGFIFPLFLIILTNLPAFFSPQKELSNSGDSISTKLDTAGVFIGIFSLAFIVFLVAFIYKFFDHRLGVVRRWVVLKPSCFAAYRNRSDREPSEVFLFDKTFTATKGSYRQGVSWMPSGFVVGSKAGFIEIDTGHYYTRLTAFCALIVVCYGIMKLSNFAYDFQHVDFPLNNAVNVSSVPALSNWTTAAPGETEVDHYCGFFFTVPDGVSVYVRPEDDDSDAVVSQLRYPANDSYSTNANYFWQSSSMAYNLGVISNSAGSGSIISVAKKINPESDLFLKTGMTYEVPKIGTLTISGMEGATSLRFHPISHFCAIPIKVAPVNWATGGRYILLLLLGGIVAPVSGLIVNYIITYLGLWHAHVRRDHWYRCVRRLQKLKRQETEYRYHSFAPARVSSTGEAPQKNNFTSFAKQAVEAAMKSRNVSDSDSSETDSKGSTQSGGSFSPVPGPPSAVAWHVDGEDTYEAMYKAISNAKYEILIAGWWVCPDLFLLRPGRKLPAHDPNDEKKTNETQLRNLLLLKAQAGVKIYVLIYREVKLALTLNSSYSKRSLLIHPNIRVLRDPIFQIQSLGFWSHHEKIVCVDQSLAFVGGLDLCFGRYDHSDHPLSDPGGSKLQDQTWPGKDYSNPIIKDFVRVNQPYEDLIDRQSQPRMPWHDVHCSVSGPPVQDIAYHFIQRWNFVCSKNDYQLRTGWCICLRSRRFKFLPKCLVPMDFNGWKLRYPSSDTSLQTVPSSAIPLAHTDSCEIEPFEVMAPNPYSAHSPGFPPHWGKGGSGSHASFTSDVPLQTAGPPLSETLGETEILRAQRGESILQVFHPNAKICNVQVCRSVSMWSAGVPTEASIQEAYIDVITKSKHFIYIENQFFISGINSNHVVSNRILQALVDRIERAVKENEVFRVYVVMPLLPAFEGNIRSEELTNLHAVMHWQFATISRGKYSLFAALENVTDKPENYVSFFGLRKYGIMPNGCVSTEQIYIHSKLMIVDDMYAILGSANINDRSMMGDRDSEIALIMEDMQFEDGRMNDQPHRRGVVVSALRLQLFREHLGLADTDDSVLDPASESTWLQIKGVSKQNTKIYENVFDCAPSNNMRAFTSFQNIEISQIYENQRLNVLKVPGRSHVWDKDNLKEGDYAPWTDVNGVPIAEDKFNLDDYVLDNVKDKKKKHLFSMDHDGWLYARNFSIFQEIRTGKTDYKKREKLQHLLTDRLMAQVRRRRWVKKGTMALQMMSRVSSVSESDDEEHNRFVSLWRRFQNGEFSRTNSLTMPNHPNIASSTSVMSGEVSYPNSPMMSSFRRTPLSPSTDSRRDSLALARSGHTRGSTFHGTGKASSLIGNANDMETHRDRESVESVSKGLGQSLRKWYSAMDLHDFGGRRSKFSAEYFDQENNTPPIVDEPLLENGRSSLHSIRSGDEDDEEVRASNELGECQIGHVQTAATVAKQDESRARGQLSEIRGHLVEFPLDFLVEEILKPSIMPSDIHI